MANYFQTADLPNGSADWLSQIGWGSTTVKSKSTTSVVLLNADNSLTVITGTGFAFSGDNPTAGTVTQISRFDSAQTTEWERIETFGFTVDLAVFKAALGNAIILGGYLFAGSDTMTQLIAGAIAYAFDGDDTVMLGKNGYVYAAGGDDDIDGVISLNLGSDNDTVDYSLDGTGNVNTRGMIIQLNTNNASYEYNAIGLARDKQTSGFQETDQLKGINHVKATFGDDVVAGNIWFDSGNAPVGSKVWTFDGDDIISRASNVWAGSGADRITTAITAGGNYRGQVGDDMFVLSAPRSDQQADIIGGAGKDTLDLYMNFSFYVDLSDPVVYISGSGSAAVGVVTHAGIENLTGAGKGDSFVGDLGRNVFMGKGGNDTLIGSGGNDELIGGDGDDELRGDAKTGFAILSASQKGDDVLDGGLGDDEMYGDGGADTLIGGAGIDRMHGESGADDLQGQNGRDWMYGGSGNDVLSGGNSIDRLWGDRGEDILNGGRQDDRLWGGANDDLLKGAQGADVLRGENGDDELIGGSHSDELFGGDGADRLGGGAWGDFLDGGDGNDRLQGDKGDDRFYYADGYDLDTVVDFRNNQDTLVLKSNLWNGTLTVNQILNQFGSIQNGNAILNFGGGDVLKVKGVNNLSALNNDIDVV